LCKWTHAPRRISFTRGDFFQGNFVPARNWFEQLKWAGRGAVNLDGATSVFQQRGDVISGVKVESREHD
jgi:hypothetical protein